MNARNEKENILSNLVSLDTGHGTDPKGDKSRDISLGTDPDGKEDETDATLLKVLRYKLNPTPSHSHLYFVHS